MPSRALASVAKQMPSTESICFTRAANGYAASQAEALRVSGGAAIPVALKLGRAIRPRIKPRGACVRRAAPGSISTPTMQW